MVKKLKKKLSIITTFTLIVMNAAIVGYIIGGFLGAILGTISIIPITLCLFVFLRYLWRTPFSRKKEKPSETKLTRIPSLPPSEELYEKLLNGSDRQTLENKINSIMKQGLRREEAIYKLALGDQ
jgi:hypothetical protein